MCWHGVLAHEFGEVSTLDEVHGVVVLALALTDLMNRDDIGVLQVGCRLSLVFEPFHVGRAGEATGYGGVMAGSWRGQFRMALS